MARSPDVDELRNLIGQGSAARAAAGAAARSRLNRSARGEATPGDRRRG